MNNAFTYTGPFMGKPRMTKADAWKKRDVVMRYWAIKDFMVLQANLQKFKLGQAFVMLVFVPIPKSWKPKKKLLMAGRHHKQRPDWDNYGKGASDILRKEDSDIYDGRVIKFWQPDVTAIDYEIIILNNTNK